MCSSRARSRGYLLRARVAIVYNNTYDVYIHEMSCNIVYDREFVRISKSVTPYKNEGKDKNKKCNKRVNTSEIAAYLLQDTYRRIYIRYNVII